MKLLQWICLLLFLCIGSVMDIRSKKLPDWYLIAGMIMGVISCIFQIKLGKKIYFDFLFGMIPGVICLIFSYLTKKIGNGDGIIILITGLFLSIQKNIEMLLLAFLLSGIVSIVLLVSKKLRKQDKIPFVPFIFVATCMMMI